jgi:hypothetical protein
MRDDIKKIVDNVFDQYPLRFSKQRFEIGKLADSSNLLPELIISSIQSLKDQKINEPAGD